MERKKFRNAGPREPAKSVDSRGSRAGRPLTSLLRQAKRSLARPSASSREPVPLSPVSTSCRRCSDLAQMLLRPCAVAYEPRRRHRRLRGACRRAPRRRPLNPRCQRRGGWWRPGDGSPAARRRRPRLPLPLLLLPLPPPTSIPTWTLLVLPPANHRRRPALLLASGPCSGRLRGYPVRLLPLRPSSRHVHEEKTQRRKFLT